MNLQHEQVNASAHDDALPIRRFLTDEEGAAYSLSFVMVIPIFALLICLIIEGALLLTAKLGTVYSAYAAARTASVWSSHTTWEKTMEKSKYAALKTMVPFSSGTQGFRDNLPTDTDTVKKGLDYWLAYKAFAANPESDKYVAAKFAYAARNVKVTIEGPPVKSDSPITAKVTYQFPFNIPGIARILGDKGSDGNYYFNISSTATIPNEGPQDDRKTIGIGYGKLE